jgi:hypothetical protein
MATRKTTLYWKENKNQYTRCLCYSDKCGLYTDTIPEGENPDELLYRPQGYAGYVINKIEIPGRNIEITILSNFGYGSASYLRAAVNFGNRRILDFELSKLYVLRNCSVSTLDVPSYSWDLLFEKIINAYNTASLDNLTTSAIAYIDELNDMLDKNEISIKGSLDSDKPSKWDGTFLISLFAGRKIQDLVGGLEAAEVSDSIVLKYTMNLCRKYVAKVKTLTLDYNDSRTSQLSESLLSVHKFMCANKGGIEYLSMILDKEV